MLGMAVAAVFTGQADSLPGPVHHQFHPVKAERFGDVIVGPDADSFHSIVNIAVPGDQDDLHIRFHVLEFGEQFQPVAVRQPDVGNNNFKAFLADHFPCGLGAVCGLHYAFRAAEFLAEQLKDGFFIVHYKYFI